MRLTIAAVGKLKAGPERELFERYVKLCKAGLSVSLGPLALIETPESRRGSAPERRQEEAANLLRKSPAGSSIVALDETGRQQDSVEFSRFLAARRDEGLGDLVFAIGGADGHGEDLLRAAVLKLALGRMTLPHGLARIMLSEQIYRAITILCSHPYHRA
ncbi:MAG: 23S rRNA (pseudouridine(1915)-N(3))-methyltransferase RlmH [Pseudomonadota bacterium]|nr:23S rRNA (pseudouridine(1915)-N(3))-methyltransferase RlmH [Pseudomonadota bacterium]